MKKQQKIGIITRQRDAANSLKTLGQRSPQFTKWYRDTEIAIEQIFGAQSRNLRDFRMISFSNQSVVLSTTKARFHEFFVQGLDNAAAVLSSMIDEIEEYGISEEAAEPELDRLSLIEKICRRFHAAARQLQSRHANRSTITIVDEYDTQDLLHAILRLHFDDIREEEWTPSYAGAASRVDFLLKAEQIVIEVKKTRASMTSKKLGEELIIDRAKYEQHPDCKILVCFVYDPEGRIGNPVGIERDLENRESKLKVRVIIAPKA